jgi:hypothetical protein
VRKVHDEPLSLDVYIAPEDVPATVIVPLLSTALNVAAAVELPHEIASVEVKTVAGEPTTM